MTKSMAIRSPTFPSESAAQLAAVIDGLHGGVLVEETGFQILLVNSAFAEMFGSSIEEIERTGSTDVLIEQMRAAFADYEKVQAAAADARAGGMRIRDEEIQLSDGRVLLRDYAPIDLGDGRHGHLWHLRDVTELTRTARALVSEREQRLRAERSARLQAEAAQTSLATRNAELRALAGARDDIVAAVSHELRTPLTSIITFLELLEDDELTVAQQGALDVVNRNTERLLRVVSDLLLFKDATTIEIELGPVPLDEVAADAVEALRPRADAAGVGLTHESEPGPPVRANRSRLAQSLDALLDNALKFTPPGGHVVVATHSDALGAQLIVRDSGKGIPAAELPHVFEQFFQGAESRRLGRGIGFGLAIASRLIDAQHGTIAVESREGQGTTFTVELDVMATEG